MIVVVGVCTVLVVAFVGGFVGLYASSLRGARNPDPPGLRTVGLLALTRTSDGDEELRRIAQDTAFAMSREGLCLEAPPYATRHGWAYRVSFAAESAWVRFARGTDTNGTWSVSIEQPLRGGPGPRWLVEAFAEAARVIGVGVAWHRRELYRAGDHSSASSTPFDADVLV